MKVAIAALYPKVEPLINVVPGGFSKHSCDPRCFYGKLPHLSVHGSPRLIYVAHPSEHKNHETLLRAMVHIVAEFPSAQLLLTLDPTARGNRRYSMLVKQISKLVNALDLTNNIVWAGSLSASQVACALSHSDVSVFPSVSESFGLPLVESLAAGCPLAVADLPFAHEVADCAAVYFDPFCSRSIAKAISRILGSDDLRRELLRAAQARAEMFSYDTISAKICEIIERCVAP